MARDAPIGEYQSQVPVQEGMRRIIPEVRPSGIGAAISDLGDAANQAVRTVQAKDAASYVGSNLANLRVAAEQHLLDNQSKSPADIDKAGGFTPAVMSDFEKSAKQTIEDAPNPIARSMMQQHAFKIGADLQIRAMAQDAQNRVAQKVSTATDAVTQAATAVELHPDSWQDAGAEQHVTIGGLGLPPEETIRLQQFSDQTISHSAARGYAKADPAGTLNRLNDPNDDLMKGLNLKSREEIEGYAKHQMSETTASNIIDAYRSMGPDQGAQYIRSVSDDPNIPADVKEASLQKAQAGISQWRSEARGNNAQAIMGLEERLSQNKPAAGDTGLVLSLYNKGVYQPDQAGELRGRIMKAQEKQVDDNANEVTATAAYRAAQALDPKDKDTRDGINSLFATTTKNVQVGSQEWINRGADIAAKTGVTPDSVITWARTQMVSADPKTVVAAAQAIDRMQTANPRGTPYALEGDKETLSQAKIINDATLAGTDPKIAVENARRLGTLSDADQLRLKEMYERNQGQIAKNSENDLKTQLKDTANGFRAHFWNGIPDVPPQMTGQFEQLRQDYFKLTNGNLDQANQLATRDLKNTWGISQVNGKREFMQFAPEAMNPGLTTEAIRQDMEASIKPLTDDPSKAKLIAIPETFHSQGQRWGIGVPDKFGAYDVVRDPKGNPLQYQLPNAAATVEKARTKAAADGMALLHAKQQSAAEAERDQWVAIEEQNRLGAF